MARVGKGAVQQFPQPALLGHGAQALGVAQLKHQRGMPHDVVGRVLLEAAQHTVVLIKRLQHGGADGALLQRFGRDVVDLLHRRLDVDAQDVHLVGVAQDLAKLQRACVQAVRQAVGAVPGHGGAQHFVLRAVVQVFGDMPLVKQHAGAHGGMVDGLRVVERAVPAQLLKAADVVQKPAQPGQVPLGRRQVQAGGDALAQRRYAVGVVDLQFDFGVVGVIACGVGGKRLPGAAAVQRHAKPSLACCCAVVVSRIVPCFDKSAKIRTK